MPHFYGPALATQALNTAMTADNDAKIQRLLAGPQLMQQKQQLDQGQQTMEQNRQSFPGQQQLDALKRQEAQLKLTAPDIKILPDGRIARITPQGQVSFEGVAKKQPEELKEEAKQRFGTWLAAEQAKGGEISPQRLMLGLAQSGLDVTEILKEEQQQKGWAAQSQRQADQQAAMDARSREQNDSRERISQEGNTARQRISENALSAREQAAANRESAKEVGQTQRWINTQSQFARQKFDKLFASPAGVIYPGKTPAMKDKVKDHLIRSYVLEQAAAQGVSLPETFKLGDEPNDPEYQAAMRPDQQQGESGGGMFDWLTKGMQAPSEPQEQAPQGQRPSAPPVSREHIGKSLGIDPALVAERKPQAPPMNPRLAQAMASIKMRENASGAPLNLRARGTMLKALYPQITEQEMIQALTPFARK